MMKPCTAPNSAPTPMPTARAMTQRNGKSDPMPSTSGIHWLISSA